MQIQYELPLSPLTAMGAPAPVPPAIKATNTSPLRIKLLDLKECMCRWPIGDPRSADFYFCGRQKQAGSSYCEHHSRIAIRPIERSRG